MDLNSVAEELGGADLANLYPYIDRDNVHGLNLQLPERARDVVKPWTDREDTTLFAESGVDDQLIIHVPFCETVRLRSLVLKLGRGHSTPRHLGLYANYPNIVDFADAENTRPHLDMSLLEGETAAVEYPLRTAALRSVHSLSLYFRDSVGGDRSRVYYIGFRGDRTSPRTEVSKKLLVPAHSAADAPLVDKVQHKVAGQQTTAR